jgi:hypothetical protein
MLLAICRIGYQASECFFGIPPSILGGGTSWKQFPGEINAVLIQRSIRHLGLHPYIRRFKNEAGCTLSASDQRISDVDSAPDITAIDRILHALQAGDRDEGETSSIRQSFSRLAELLTEAGWSERAGKSSLLSGSSITLRAFTLSKGENPDSDSAPSTMAPCAEYLEPFATLADQ